MAPRNGANLLVFVRWNNSRIHILFLHRMPLFIHLDESWDHTSESLFIFLIFTITYNPNGLYSNNPALIRRGVSKFEHVSESFKLFSSKRFGEDVCNLIICGKMSKMYCLGLYMMLNQMILCVDMFGLIMESRILSQLDCGSIVDQ